MIHLRTCALPRDGPEPRRRLCTLLPRRSSQGVYLRSLFLFPVKQRIVKRQALNLKKQVLLGLS